MVKIYKPKEKVEMFLSLKEVGEGVDLVIVDKNGRTQESTHILRITHEGKLITFPGVSREIAIKAGIALDDDGEIE